MASLFRSLRNVNKTYTNPSLFLTDNIGVINHAPGGFSNVLSANATQALGNGRYMPGYNVGVNNFVSTPDMNRILRNNDSTGINAVFGNAPSANDINGMNMMRRADNIPDANLHSVQVRKDAVAQSHPNTNTTTPEGVEQVLNQNPRLSSYLDNLKTAGYAGLLGVGVYLTFSAATLVQDVIAAINRTGGSYYVRGFEGGDQSMCLLRHRTCRFDHNAGDVEICSFDPLIQNQAELAEICVGFNYEREESVCRRSDPNAPVDSPQYLDISPLSVDQTITCIEPYNMGDLIGDLGLDGLLGDQGLFTKSSNKSTSLSESLLPVLLMIGALILIALIGYFVFKKLGSGKATQTISFEPIPTAMPLTTVPLTAAPPANNRMAIQ
jgi:Baculoviral E56 protein, specific to ODV envelope